MNSSKDINQIILGCVKNKRKSQEQLFKLFYGKMLYLCLRYTRDNDTAQEMVQEGFIKVFDKINLFEIGGNFESWLRRVISNNCIDFIRKNKKVDFVEFNGNFEENSSEFDNPFEVDFETQHTNRHELALECIQELSPAYQLVFNMFYVEDYSHKEIAEKLNISEGTSKSNLLKAKMRIKEIVEKKLNNKDQNEFR